MCLTLADVQEAIADCRRRNGRRTRLVHVLLSPGDYRRLAAENEPGYGQYRAWFTIDRCIVMQAEHLTDGQLEVVTEPM